MLSETDSNADHPEYPIFHKVRSAFGYGHKSNFEPNDDNALFEFASVLPVTSLHLFVLAEKCATPVTGFVPKQSFRLRLPKPKREQRTTHYFRILENEGGAPIALQPSSVGEKDTAERPAEQNETTQNGSIPRDRWQTDLAAIDSNFIWYAYDKPIGGFSGVI